MTISRLVARPMLATVFYFGAASALKNAEPIAGKVQPVTDRVSGLLQKAAPAGVVPTDPKTLVRLNAVTQIVAATGLATGTAPRLSAGVLAASLVPTTVAGHPFWKESDPQAKNQQRLQFAKNTSVLGGLILAAVDTDGKPGLAWRAGRAAKDARREARRLAKDVRREAKLAAHSLPGS